MDTGGCVMGVLGNSQAHLRGVLGVEGVIGVGG